MKYVYVDNFRGFQDTLIPLKKVNFLIGENSTGKTSVLSLLNLLSAPQFWQQYEFNTDQVELGNFKNIVSIESKNRGYFRIGFLMNESSGEKNNDALVLMTFTEENDLPFLSQFNYLDHQVEMEFKISNGVIKHWGEIAKNVDISPVGILDKIKNWKTNANEKKLKPLPKKRFDGSAGMPPLTYFLLTEIDLKKPGFEALSFLSSPMKSLIEGFLKPFIWIAPIRSKPRRTYDRYKYGFSPEGEHSPYLIKKLLTHPEICETFLKFIEAFGVDSNLLNSVEINTFGNDPSSPFELMVRLNGKLININYVGYGISQCLPLLVEMFSRENGSWFAVQQPEVHLHPKAQAALGRLIHNLALNQDKNFLIETHSDYIIDRFRLTCRQDTKSKIDSQVLYFERTEQGNTVYMVDIEENGNYSENQPKSFRDFFVKEQMDLLSLD
jgi:predicted ATPase